MSKKMKTLLSRAVESLDEQSLAAAADVDFATADLMASEEDGVATALEALAADAHRLESLDKALHDIPNSSGTPKLFEVVQATITSPGEPAIATESDESGWAKTKSYVKNAASATGKAVKDAAKQMLELLDKILSWFMDTRKNTSKTLAANRAALASAPQNVDIKYNRRFKPLTYQGSFSYDSAKSTMGRYAAVAHAMVTAIDGAVVYSNTLLEALINKMDKHQAFPFVGKNFVTKTAGVINWQNKGEQSYGNIYDGQGGMKISVFVGNGSASKLQIEADTNNGNDDTRAVSFDFNKAQMGELIKGGEAMLNGVAKLEPYIKKLQADMRKMLAQEILVNEGGATLQHNGGTLTMHLFNLRSFVNATIKLGIDPAVRAAHAVGHLSTAFIKGSSSDGETTGQGKMVMQGALPAPN